MKFKLVETLLTEGKNIEKTWNQYKDRIIKKLKEEDSNLFRGDRDLPWDGSPITDEAEIERRAKDAWISMLAIDPTMDKTHRSNTTGDYGVWLTNMYLADEIKWWNADRLEPLLKEFTKKKISLEKKDINQYKSIRELEKAVESVDYTERQKERMLRSAYGDSEFVWKDNEWVVYRVTTYASACTLGKGTQWCTAYSGEDDYYKSYTADGNLYVIINLKDQSEKYQLFVPNENAKNHYKVQMQDKYDGDMHGHKNYPIDVDEFLELESVTDGLRNCLEKLGIHKKLEDPENADVLAVMEATGQTADSALEDLENGSVEVIPDVSTYEELGRYLIETYAFDEAFLVYVNWEAVGQFVVDDPVVASNSDIDFENDSLETIGEKYFKQVARYDFEWIENLDGEYGDIVDYARLGYDNMSMCSGEFTRYGVVLFH